MVSSDKSTYLNTIIWAAGIVLAGVMLLPRIFSNGIENIDIGQGTLVLAILISVGLAFKIIGSGFQISNSKSLIPLILTAVVVIALIVIFPKLLDESLQFAVKDLSTTINSVFSSINLG